MAIQIRSFNQILGDMIRTIIAQTPLNDLNAGSVLLTLLEAAAANDFENNVAILNVLELLNIDATQNSDLDARAADFGITRYPAKKASGQVTITNSNITKQSTGLYVIEPAPILGQTVLFVNNTTGWAPSGTLYIGRGTPSFEGPIAYSSIQTFATYSQINLSSALQRDHLISDTVVNAQGQPDYLITAGTVVSIPANSQNPEVQYVTLRDAILPAGEQNVTGVNVIARVAGSQGNAGINTVTGFDTAPFTGATVTNTNIFSNGSDIETDVELRNRIKNYSVTLARGTVTSIIAAVIGVSDPVDDKQVVSATITEPTNVGQPSILYIDDGTGFQPSYTGQSVDILLNNANGTEEFLQLSNYPVTRPQIINNGVGPFVLTPGSFLRVIVDGTAETVTFEATDFINIASATLAEVVAAINNRASTFTAYLTDDSNKLLLQPLAFDTERFQVSPLQNTDNAAQYANTEFQFPTNEVSYIALFQNSNRLRAKAISATLVSNPFGAWNISTSGDLSIAVDGTPTQDRSFSLSDFVGASSFASLSISDWATAFNNKFAGLTAVATSIETLNISSNKVGSGSSIQIVGGSYINNMFSNVPLSATGQTSQFELNRQTGNLEILTDIAVGDVISAGVADARGYSISTATTSGNYNVSSDAFGRESVMVVVPDSTFCVRRSLEVPLSGTLTIQNPSGSVMRILAPTTTMFQSTLPGDYVFIANRSSAWLSAANTGLFKIFEKGNHTTAGVDTYVDVHNMNVVVESATIQDSSDVKAFSTDGYPQIFSGVYTSNPPADPISDFVATLNSSLVNVLASVFKTNSIKLTSTTELNGSIAIPVSTGPMTGIFAEEDLKIGNPPLIANRVSDKSLISYFKSTAPTNTYLNRQVWDDQKGALTANAEPSAYPFTAPYSEELQSTGELNNSNVSYDDYILMTRGNNRGQFRSIAAFLASDTVGTQENLARTVINHTVGDEFEIIEPLRLSATDTVVVVMDQDPNAKTININMARTGQVNSGNGTEATYTGGDSTTGTFIPNTTSFSANDFDNQPGIDFGNVTVWGTTVNHTNFSDYAVWMRSHNWYVGGGLSQLGIQGSMIVRANEYGANGNKLRFSLSYPAIANQSPNTVYNNTPSWSELTYVFGSGNPRAVAISGGTSITVKGPYPDSSTNFPDGATSTGSYYDYTFGSGTFSSVMVGDILAINPGSGVSAGNSGQFRVANINGNTLRVLNPTASVTAAGAPTVTTVTTVADVTGTPNTYTIGTVADVSGNLNQKYFEIYDSQGSVAVWYDLNNVGAPPPAAGTNRYIKVSSVVTNDSAANVATKTGQAISLDNAFTTVGVVGNQVTVKNNINGNFSNGAVGTSGFTVATSNGTNPDSVNGKYFLLNDSGGQVSVWYDVNNQGTPEPFDGSYRSIRIGTVTSGMTAIQIASATVQALNSDLAFTATNAGGTTNVITVNTVADGNFTNVSAGTSGFTVTAVAGSLPGPEVINTPSGVTIFPLSGNDVATIATIVNAGEIIEITPVGTTSLTIAKATREEDYAYSGNSTALAYGHNPNNPAINSFISLYDGLNWVQSFENSNPNFMLKTAYLLQGVAPSIYSMDTVPNYGVATNGELFKLIPVTVQNVYHQMTQPALSQLPLVAAVNIADDRKNVQIVSNNLGSAGSVQIVGGNANSVKGYLVADAETASDSSGEYLVAKVAAFPDTYNVGDTVMLTNDTGVQRQSRLQASDSINVTSAFSNVFEYNFNPKPINTSAGTTFTITDVSASYGQPSGFIWRWTDTSSSIVLTDVNAGDMVYAFGPTLSWAQGNKAKLTGDTFVAGLPIVNVPSVSGFSFDVSNPYGQAMSATAIGSGNTVQICPTPVIRWSLPHASRVSISTMVAVSNTVTVNTTSPHYINTNDSVDISDSLNLADGVYGGSGNLVVTSPTQFYFTFSTGNFSETSSGASVIKDGLVRTRYRLENLKLNGLVRLQRQDGQSPNFVASGVAVDDYIVISGSTFQSNNNGTFRVVAVDTDSVMLLNEFATDQLNTISNFNNNSLEATWTANTNIVTGTAGTFKYVSVGSWVKQTADDDSLYLQVISMTPSTPATATSITLGGNYGGSTAISPGIVYDEFNNYDKGVYLQNADDIAIYEGDATLIGDTLTVQNITNSNWFSPGNIGTFPIAQTGTSSTYKPFIRVNNTAGVLQNNVLLSVSQSGVYTTESLANKFYSIRNVSRAAIDNIDQSRRSLYIRQWTRGYKFTVANKSSVSHMGKLGYNTEIIIGNDGYTYYTGLLQTVQRVVDGFDPDIQTYPGQRAVGGLIETLPPLIRPITLALTIATNNGINLNDITNQIVSSIISYIEGLQVGEGVVLSQITANLMQINGVASVVFTTPTPSTAMIAIGNNQKATISAANIGIS